MTRSIYQQMNSRSAHATYWGKIIDAADTHVANVLCTKLSTLQVSGHNAFPFSHVFLTSEIMLGTPGTDCGQVSSAVEQNCESLVRNSLVWLWSNPVLGPQGGAVALFSAIEANGENSGGKYTVAKKGGKTMVRKVEFYKFLNFMTALQQWNVHSICWEVSTANMHWAY